MTEENKPSHSVDAKNNPAEYQDAPPEIAKTVSANAALTNATIETKDALPAPDSASSVVSHDTMSGVTAASRDASTQASTKEATAFTQEATVSNQDSTASTQEATASMQAFTASTQASSTETQAVLPESLRTQYHPLILSDLSQQSSTSFWRGYARFWPFLKPYWFLALLGILLTIPVGALDAVVALFLKPFTDNVMVAQEASFVAYVPFVVVGFTLLQGIFIYLSSLVNSYVGGAINLLMRQKLYQKLLSCNSSFYDANNTGSVMLRFSGDVDTATNGLIQNIKLFLTKLFSSLSLVGVLLYNSWQLTIFAIGVVCFLIIPMRIVRKQVKSIVNTTVSASTNMLTLYNETTLGSKVIKSFNLKDYMYQRFYEQAYFLFRMGMKMVRNTNWLSPLMHLVSAIGVAIVLYLGVDMILSGTITSGEFISFLAALIMLYTPLKSIGNDYIQVQTALLALDRIYDLLNYESFENGKHEGTKVLSTIKDSIEFDHVAFSYNGERDVLKDVSFKVKVGEKVALVGNSGGGKTTVCSLITRLYEIKSGSIKIDGVDIKDYTLESLRSQVSFVFQDNFLFQGTVRQNLLLGKEHATAEELQVALKSAYLDEFVDSLPKGLDTEIGERGVTLSGGQKQRLAIARAILRNSPLVVLDEATSALDNRSEKVVQHALDELMKGRTTIVIAHRLSTIRDADCILVINDGYIVEQGAHEELLALDGAYAALYKSQFKAKEDAETSASTSATAEGNEDTEAPANAATVAAAKQLE